MTITFDRTAKLTGEEFVLTANVIAVAALLQTETNPIERTTQTAELIKLAARLIVGRMSSPSPMTVDQVLAWTFDDIVEQAHIVIGIVTERMEQQATIARLMSDATKQVQ